MSRRLVSLTLDNLPDLPTRCRSCVFWELDPVAGERACGNGDTDLEKEVWISDTLLEWGSCGLLCYVDDAPAGYALYAPAAYVPRSIAFPTSPVGADSVLLMTAHVLPEFAGSGLGRMLVQGVAREVVRRGVRAVEAFGQRCPAGGSVAEESAAQAGAQPAGAPGADARADERCHGRSCLLPADYLLAVGFKTVRPHRETPRLRLDLRSAVTWKQDVEQALERLLVPARWQVSATR